MKRLFVFLLLLITLSVSAPALQVPVTGLTESGLVPSTINCKYSSSSQTGAQLSALSTKRINQIAVEDIFSFSVVEQPINNPGFISENENAVTRFRTADKYGSTGFLAHNYLAGSKFLELKVGDRIDLTIENEDAESFWVFSIRKFQALSPCSAYSDFIDLKTGERFSAAELFMEFYGQDGLIVLQTCLEKDGVQSWGRIFIMAYPTSAVFYKPWQTENDSYLPPEIPLLTP